MATVRDIVKGAYGRLSLLPIGQDLDPDRAAEGLTVFVDLVNELALSGIFPGGPNAPAARYASAQQNSFLPHGPDNTTNPLIDSPLDYSLDDAFPFPSFFVGGFKSLLAEQIADNAGTVASQTTLRMSAKCRTDMLAYFITAPMSDFDAGLTHMPSQRRSRRGDIINDNSVTVGSVVAGEDEVTLEG